MKLLLLLLAAAPSLAQTTPPPTPRNPTPAQASAIKQRTAKRRADNYQGPKVVQDSKKLGRKFIQDSKPANTPVLVRPRPVN